MEDGRTAISLLGIPLDIVDLNPFLDHRGQSARVLAELTGSLVGQTILGTNPL